MRRNAKFPEWLLWAAVAILIIAVYVRNGKTDISGKTAPALPQVYSDRDAVNTSSIDQIASDSERIYLLLDDQEGVIQIYDTNGVYANSVRFFSHINGAFRIAAADGTFYVCDKLGNLYLFTDGEFTRFMDYETSAPLRRSIDFEGNSAEFILREGSVWKVAGDGESCVINRPKTALLYQGRIQMLVGIGIIALFGVVIGVKKTARNQK